jgi:RHS repeat-associated protein
MLTMEQQTSQGGARLASKGVCWDAETRPRNPQASYYGARYYDQNAGRFMSEDPLRYGGGLNLYLYVKNQAATLNDPQGLKPPSKNRDLNCLICTVYAEGGGQPAPCQYAIASVILNRVGAARQKGKRATICSIVAASGQFDGYGDKNYKGCSTCSVAHNRQPDLDQTIANFQVPFEVSDNVFSFGSNTPAMKDYFGKRLGLPLIDVPNCPKLVFYGQAGAE